MLTIEVERCTGCGTCADVCPEGAIALVDGVARIDSNLCTECGACDEACPEGAIHVAKPVAVRAATTPTVTSPSPIERHPSPLGVVLGTTLAFVGREVVPRLASTLVDALGQRLVDRPSSASAASLDLRGGSHRHRRRRGGNGTGGGGRG